MADRNYWVRTEHGRVWGPYTLEKLGRLKGQLTESSEASLDGKEWHPGTDFPELKDILAPPRKIEKVSSPPPAAGPRISKAIAEAFGITQTPAVAEAPRPAVEKPLPKKAAEAPPPPPEKLELSESGSLAETSPVRLYALAALTNASGWLVLELEKGRLLTISFRRGTPEHVSADDPDLSLIRYLLQRGIVPPEKALEAEEQATKSGQDVVSVLFQMQLIPPADAAKLLSEYANFLLDKALVSWRGKYSFEKDAPAPPGAFPLGAKWTLLAESVRRLEAPLIRARLGKRLLRPVVRSGGLGVGKVEELALNAQEARLYASIDGTRTGEELLKAGDASVTLRLLYLLMELGHLSFAETPDAATDPELNPVQAAPPPEPAPPEPAKPAPAPAEKKRELPKTAREVGRHAPPPRPSAPPPVMKASAPPVMRPPPATPTPAAGATKAAAPMGPPPTFAQGPANESPQAAQKRLAALLERLLKADHFEALGMDRKGGAAEAKRNFFVLAKELHPDTVSDPALAELRQMKERVFARINEAAQVLGDEKKRKEYEDELEGKKNSVDVARIFAAEEDFQRAEIMIKARKYKEGLELLEKAIALNDQEAEFYAWRGYARFLLAQDRKLAYDESADDCRKAIKMIDKCVPAHLFLGHMSKVVGDLKLAKRCYQRVLELEPKHVEAQRELRLMGTKA